MNYLELKKNPKNGYGYIYVYTSPSGKKYVGQTTYSIYDRAKKDGKGYKNCSIFYRAIQKYGIENFDVQILEEVPEELLEEKEAEYIAKFNCVKPNGYNYYDRGCGERHTKLSTEIDVYDLDLNYIKSFPSLIDAAREYSIPYQAISQCINHNIEYYKDKIYTRKDEAPSLPKNRKLTHGRKTAQYDLDGNLLAIFPSANEAAKAIGKNTAAGRNIRSVCSGDRQTAYGFKWKYID